MRRTLDHLLARDCHGGPASGGSDPRRPGQPAEFHAHAQLCTRPHSLLGRREHVGAVRRPVRREGRYQGHAPLASRGDCSLFLLMAGTGWNRVTCGSTLPWRPWRRTRATRSRRTARRIVYIEPSAGRAIVRRFFAERRLAALKLLYLENFRHGCFRNSAIPPLLKRGSLTSAVQSSPRWRAKSRLPLRMSTSARYVLGQRTSGDIRSWLTPRRWRGCRRIVSPHIFRHTGLPFRTYVLWLRLLKALEAFSTVNRLPKRPIWRGLPTLRTSAGRSGAPLASRRRNCASISRFVQDT